MGAGGVGLTISSFPVFCLHIRQDLVIRATALGGYIPPYAAHFSCWKVIAYHLNRLNCCWVLLSGLRPGSERIRRTLKREREAKYASERNTHRHRQTERCAYPLRTANFTLSLPLWWLVIGILTGTKRVAEGGCKNNSWLYLAGSATTLLRGFKKYMPRTKESMGIPSISRQTPIMLDIKILKQLPPRAPNGRLLMLEKLAIINGIHRGLTVSRIAKTYKMSVRTVNRFKAGLFGDPLSVFNLPVVIRIGKGLFQCRVCGEVKNRLSQAQRHVLGHYFAPEIARNIDLPQVL